MRCYDEENSSVKNLIVYSKDYPQNNMSATTTPMTKTYVVGAPRFNPAERLRHRFYEPLILLWILNSARGPTPVQPTVGHTSREFPSSLREFLDSLAWLCDHKHGGMSVCAVAAEALPVGTRFWFASKQVKGRDHLQWILETLGKMDETPESDGAQVEESIARTSIAFCKDKIKNYRRNLTRRTEIAREDTVGDHLAGMCRVTLCLGAEDEIAHGRTDAESLKSIIVALTTGQDDDFALCKSALHFSHREMLDRLVNANSVFQAVSDWSLVRHRLRKLGSWHRKASVVTKFARRYPRVLENFSSKWLQLPGPSKMPERDHKTNLRSALGRMLPKDKQDKAQELYERLIAVPLRKYETEFPESYGNQELSLAVHAEVYLLEDFYFNNRRFVGNEKYLGCSKPSCYCCALYIRNHPGNFVLRPAHGTAWVTWRPPLEEEQADNEQYRKHNLDMMNKIIPFLRRDVLTEIENLSPQRLRRLRLPDSLTGVGSESVEVP